MVAATTDRSGAADPSAIRRKAAACSPMRASGDGDDGDLGHAWQRHEDFLHLGGADVLSPRMMTSEIRSVMERYPSVEHADVARCGTSRPVEHLRGERRVGVSQEAFRPPRRISPGSPVRDLPTGRRDPPA